MKKIGIFILSLVSISLIGNYTQANNEYAYTNLDITANILEDGTIDIKEDFTANFFVQKHGIIRDIPLDYTVGGKRFLNFIIGGDDFHIEVFNVYVQGKNFTTSQSGGNIEIKIGDDYKTLTGKQNYPISYSTYGLIRNFSGMGYAELYWNLVGNEFDTNINKVRAEIILPKAYTGFTADDFLITADGKSKTIDGFDGTVDWSQGDKIIITYNKGLSAKHGITLSIKFPNDYFVFDHTRQAALGGHIGPSVGRSLVKNIVIFVTEASRGVMYIIIPIFLLLILIGVDYLIKKIRRKRNQIRCKKGGNLKGNFADEFPVIVQYNPPTGISSAEASLLLNRRAEPISLVSLVYKWAAEGLISIKIDYKKDRDGKDTKKIKSITLNRLGEIDKSAPSYEKKFFKSLCSSDTKTILGSGDINIGISKLNSLEKYGIDNGWITAYGYEKIFKALPRILFIIFWPTLIFTLIYYHARGIITIPIFIVLIIISDSYYSKRKHYKELTKEGAKILSHVLGYREFLMACDENKLKSFLKKDPSFLDNTLPYATVFGIDSELINKILPIMQELNINPNRYNSDLNSMGYFISGMNEYTPSMPFISSLPTKTGPGGKGSWSGGLWGGGASYSSDSGWSSGSSFLGGGSNFSNGGGGGGGGGSSW